MRAIIEKDRAAGSIKAPPSKSEAHRFLICGAISDGVTEISDLPENDDTKATLDCLRALGVKIEEKGGQAVVHGNVAIGFPMPDGGVRRLYCRESGSTLRFLLPLALTDGVPTVFYGERRLFERPLSVYEDICREQDITFDSFENGLYVCGRLRCGDYRIPGDISSQFISGLLFALFRLAGDSRIILTSRPESAPYIRMTLDALERFGLCAEYNGSDTFTVRGGKVGVSPGYLIVPGDHSGAAVFGALNSFGGNIKISGLEENSLQGDRVWKELLPLLASGTPSISLADCPDLGPVLMVTAALQNGATFTDTARLRLKESDRISAMAEELGKCGVRLTVGDNSVYVPGGCVTGRADFSGHRDHRVVMALALLASVVGGSVGDAESVSKSMPEFWSLLESVGIRVRLTEE